MTFETHWTEKVPEVHGNFLMHIYVTYADSIIQDYIANGKKEAISRAKIEKDILRLIHEDENLPISYKIACTSSHHEQILHTNAFEPFWYGYKLRNELPSQSIKRMTPNYDLLDRIPCPQRANDLENFSTTGSTPELFSNGTEVNGVNGHSFSSYVTVNNSNVTNGDHQSFSSSTKSTKTRRPSTRVSTRKSTTAATKNSTQKSLKKALPSNSGTFTAQQKRASRAKTSAGMVTLAAKPTGVIKNTTPKEPQTVAAVRRARSGREVFEELMARTKNEYVGPGPSSGESSSDDSSSTSSEEP